jgi:hypothetical protein
MKVNPTTYPISWFKDRNLEKALVLKPPYQRKPVWTDKQKAYLIDTILKHYHIPEMYIHRETSSTGQAIYNVVDGQQRIRSVLDFITGDFSLLEEYTPEYTDYNFDDLPDTVKKDFWGYTLYVREITEATEDDVRNLFKRMNQNVVPLNPQELRHATYSGDFIKLMEEIAENEIWAENKIVTSNEIRRMNDVQFISDLFISLMDGIQDKTKEMDKYYAQYEVDFTDKVKWYTQFNAIISTIIKIFPNLRDTRWRNKSDFYTLFMVLREVMLEKKYIPEEKYKQVQKDLLSFSDKVNEAVKREVKTRFSIDVKTYVDAVKKSTTDKDRRISRHKIIHKIISKYAKKEH